MDPLPVVNPDKIIAGMADALILLSFDRRILAVNEAALDLFGYTKDELLGQPLTMILSGSEGLFLAKKFKELKEKKIIRDYVAVSRSKAGTEIPMSLSMSILREDERDIGVICVGKDMREVKRNMLQLREMATLADRVAAAEKIRTKDLENLNTQLEKANRAKSEFLINMSHELRTPLNSVIGFSEVLLNQTFGSINPKQEEYLNDIVDSGRHLLSLINDILDLSKVEAGKEDLALSEFSLKSLMDESVTMFGEKALKYNLQFSAETDGKIDEIIADKRKIKQIIFNLLSNSSKFTPSGGKIKLTAKENGDECWISVEDTGKGIAAEDFEKVFDKFQQLDSGYTKKFAGTGVGLALVKQFVNLHRGRVWVESEVDKGAKFTFTVPRNLDHKIFDMHTAGAFEQAMSENLFLAFILIKLVDLHDVPEEKATRDEVVQTLEDLATVISRGLYRPEDKVFKLQNGFCAVILGKTGIESVEVVLNRIKSNLDKYRSGIRARDLDIVVKMVTYPGDIKNKEGVIASLTGFGLYGKRST
jgi:PAS domain S-box-containing protein